MKVISFHSKSWQD